MQNQNLTSENTRQAWREPNKDQTHTNLNIQRKPQTMTSENEHQWGGWKPCTMPHLNYTSTNTQRNHTKLHAAYP